MGFYNIVIIIALFILILLLILFGVFFNKFSSRPFPDSQDNCPKLWNDDTSSNCMNPVDSSSNRLPQFGAWNSDTPGYVPFINGGFNTNDEGWNSYDGAKNEICGKQKWAKKYNVEWNGVTTYNDC